MDNESFKKYHGYLTLSRHSLLLQQELGYELFGFYLSLIMIAVWSRKNKNYCSVVKSQSEIAQQLGISQSAVSRRLKELERHKKYYVLRHKEYIRLGYLPLFMNDVCKKIHSKNYTDTTQLYADMHGIDADLQEHYAEMQDHRAQMHT